MGRFYDKDGKQIGVYQFADLSEDLGYCRIALDHASPEVIVSTVWIGMDHHPPGDGVPLIFETAVYIDGELDITARYATRKEALAGHASFLKLHTRMAEGIKAASSPG